MMIQRNTLKVGLLTILLTGLVGLFFIGCAGGKSSGSVSDSSELSSSQSVEASPELDSLKQSAESAEWEAHRLREQVYRKKQAQ